MRNRFHQLLNVLAGSSQRDLRQQIQFLKAENEILRAKLPRVVRTTRKERRRLLELAKPLSSAILKRIVTIVRPETFAGWVRKDRKERAEISLWGRSGRREKRLRRKGGRPRTDRQIRNLILRLARETEWGYTRILGELRKLGINRVSQTTVANILRDAGIEPAPNRGEEKWNAFLKRHAKTLWACDFVSKRIWTSHGVLKTAYLLIFIHIKSRRVIVTESTLHPDSQWVIAQAQKFIEMTRSPAFEHNQPRILLRDRDTKFMGRFRSRRKKKRVNRTSRKRLQNKLIRKKVKKNLQKQRWGSKLVVVSNMSRNGRKPLSANRIVRPSTKSTKKTFGSVLKEAGIKSLVLPYKSPNLNAFAERFVQTLKHECLDRFIVLGTSHLDYLTREYVDYYNKQRPHSALERHKAPAGPIPNGPAFQLSSTSAESGETEVIDPSRVRCEQRLGGLIKHYHHDRRKEAA